MYKHDIRNALKRLIWRVHPELFMRLAVNRRRREFSIGIYAGETPWSVRPKEGVRNPVITGRAVSDVPALFVADPFMVKVGETFYMFFEVFSLLSRKGEIGLATSHNGDQWTYSQIVLSEPFHLSFPCVFEWKNDIFMLPEATANGSLDLYKASPFPLSWSRVATLFTGPRIVDSCIFMHEDTWYLMTDMGPSGKQPVLRMFWADELAGPWVEHPASPIVSGNPHIARPGGRVQIVNGRPVRFPQDILPTYGSSVGAFEIVILSKTRYAERPLHHGPILGPGPELWHRDGMHHIDAYQLDNGSWLAAVDGFRWRDPDSVTDHAANSTRQS